MTSLEPIEVECYSGGRADERPRRIKVGGKTFRVARLLEESIEEASESRGRIHRYRVLTDDGIMEIVRDEDAWYLTLHRPCGKP